MMEQFAAGVQELVAWLSGVTGLSAGTVLMIAATTGIAWAKKLAKIAAFVLILAVLVFGYFHGWFTQFGIDPNLYQG